MRNRPTPPLCNNNRFIIYRQATMLQASQPGKWAQYDIAMNKSQYIYIIKYNKIQIIIYIDLYCWRLEKSNCKEIYIRMIAMGRIKGILMKSRRLQATGFFSRFISSHSPSRQQKPLTHNMPHCSISRSKGNKSTIKIRTIKWTEGEIPDLRGQRKGEDKYAAQRCQ